MIFLKKYIKKLKKNNCSPPQSHISEVSMFSKLIIYFLFSFCFLFSKNSFFLFFVFVFKKQCFLFFFLFFVFKKQFFSVFCFLRKILKSQLTK